MTEQQPIKRLYRSRTDKMLSGICGGLAEYFGLDPALVRVGMVLGAFFTGGTLAVGYLIAIFIIPEKPDDTVV